MIRISVLYPKTADSHFDMAYYVNKHVPMVQEKLAHHGLVRAEIDEGLGGMDPTQPAPFACVGYMVFNTVEEFQGGMATHGNEILGDIPNYTNVQPQVLISRIVE